MAALETGILPLEHLSAQAPDSYIAKCCSSWTPCTKPGFQNRYWERGGGARARRWLEKAMANARGNQKHQEKKLEKSKKVQGNFFASLYFWPRGRKISTRERDRASEGTKTSTELQIQANYLTLLLCGAAGSAQEPNHDFISQPFFHFFYFLTKSIAILFCFRK